MILTISPLFPEESNTQLIIPFACFALNWCWNLLGIDMMAGRFVLSSIMVPLFWSRFSVVACLQSFRFWTRSGGFPGRPVSWRWKGGVSGRCLAWHCLKESVALFPWRRICTETLEFVSFGACSQRMTRASYLSTFYYVLVCRHVFHPCFLLILYRLVFGLFCPALTLSSGLLLTFFYNFLSAWLLLRVKHFDRGGRFFFCTQ